MSIRVDSSSLITGAVVVGVPGLGVLAELVPSTGEHGGGIASTWLGPEDAGKEVRVLVTSWPATGTLFVFEDTSFDYDGPSTTFDAQLYIDGAAVGTPQTVAITVGGVDLEIDLATHTHTADTLALSAGSTLVIQSASHPHSVDALALAAGLSLDLHDSSHAHAADATALAAGLSLDLHDSLHAHGADTATLSAALTLSVAESLHTHGADNIELTVPALTTYLSFPTVIEITATSARPQVTITYPG